ncbi:MAG: type VI secretion system tip protein TssI/VgrG [Polyangiaceae bacterium]
MPRRRLPPRRPPHPDLSPAHPLLVTGTRFEGDVQLPWKLDVQTVFASAPYRPRPLTPKPVLRGVQRATVVGPPGEEIHTDEFGRVRVQFPWDREGKHDPGSSPWIRVSQGWAGPGYGLITIPRIGQEVLVEHEDGDPDCPLVTGRLHNGEQLVPHPLPDHKTVSTFKTDSSPRKPPPEENGFHEIKYDDTRGAELFYLQSERDLARLVKRDSLSQVGRDRTRIVGRDDHTSAERDHTESIQRDDRATVARDRNAQVRGDQAVVTGGRRTAVVHGSSTVTAGHDHVTTVGESRRTVTGAHETLLAGARYSVAIAPGVPDRVAQGAADTRDDTPLGRFLAPVASLLAGALSVAREGAIGAVAAEAATGPLSETSLAAAVRAPLAALSTLWPAPVETVVEMVQAPLARLLSFAHVPGEVLPRGPTTRIEMIERRITLTTGGATIELDGPNITVRADGDLGFVGQKKVVLNCQEGRMSVRAGGTVHVNPDGAGEVAVDLTEAPKIYAHGGLQFEHGLLRLGPGGTFTLPEASRALAPPPVQAVLHELGAPLFLEAASLAGLAPGDRIGALADLAARAERPLSAAHLSVVLSALYGGEPPSDLTSIVALLGEGASPRTVPGALNTALRARLFDAFLGAADPSSALASAASLAGQYAQSFASDAEKGFSAARRPMDALLAFARKAGGPDRPGPVAAFRAIADFKRSMLRLGLLGHMGFEGIDAFDALANRAHDAMKIADSVELQKALSEIRSLFSGTALLAQLAPPDLAAAASQLFAFAGHARAAGPSSLLSALHLPAPSDWASRLAAAQALFAPQGAAQ